jgi:hypothetical protein
VIAMREYTLREHRPGHWEIGLRPSEIEECTVLYEGPLLGATELLTYLEDPSTPSWALGVATWEENDLESFLRRLNVLTPSRKIDRLKRVVALLAEGQHPRPMGVA